MFWDIETARVIPTRKNIYILDESAAHAGQKGRLMAPAGILMHGPTNRCN
jgi:hypothetical protein